MADFTHLPRTRVARRTAALAAAAALALPALIGPATAASAVSSVRAADPPKLEPPDGVPVGGPRMAEGGLVKDPSAPALPGVNAKSFVVADAHSGQVLAAFDPHGRYRPASTQKTLLALTMLPRLDPNSTYVASQEDANQEGTRVGMWPGQEYRIEDLWYGLMLRSGNDAALGLAKAGGGGDLAKGVQMMRDEAARLQAYDTTVVSPSGLDEDGQYSSAYDLALWGRAGLQRGDFSDIVKTVKWQFPGNRTKTATKKTEKDFWVYTENRLLLQDYEGAIGVKMGYTTKAQNTMIAAAERDGRKIVVSIMGAGFGAITPGAKALLEWGFDNVGEVTPVGQLVEPTSPAMTGYGADGFARPEPRAEDRDIDAEALAKAIASSDDDSSGGMLPVGISAPGKSWAVPVAVVIALFAAAFVTLRVLAVRKRRREYWIQEVRRRNAAASQARQDQLRAEAGAAGSAEAGSGRAPASE